MNPDDIMTFGILYPVLFMLWALVIAGVVFLFYNLFLFIREWWK